MDLFRNSVSFGNEYECAQDEKGCCCHSAANHFYFIRLNWISMPRRGFSLQNELAHILIESRNLTKIARE